jgi:cytochrome c556
MKMMNRIGYLTLAFATALVACRGSSAAHDEHAAASPDTRAPLPLTATMANHQKQEMRDHLRVVQEVTTALAKDDFDAVAKSAARIGWSEQQAQMCKHMGAGAVGFAEVGEHFHKTADTIAEAAKRRDHAGVVAAVGATLQTCVGCHEAFRQDIVDEPTFTKMTGSPAMDPSCPMMHGT